MLQSLSELYTKGDKAASSITNVLRTNGGSSGQYKCGLFLEAGQHVPPQRIMSDWSVDRV